MFTRKYIDIGVIIYEFYYYIQRTYKWGVDAFITWMRRNYNLNDKEYNRYYFTDAKNKNGDYYHIIGYMLHTIFELPISKIPDITHKIQPPSSAEIEEFVRLHPPHDTKKPQGPAPSDPRNKNYEYYDPYPKP